MAAKTANHVRALIHASGNTMTWAKDYYSNYKFELSQKPADDMIIDDVVDLTTKATAVTFLTVLEQMIQAAQDGFSEVLIVAHGHTGGFTMPLAPGLHTADKDNFPTITQLAGVVRERDRIKKLGNSVDQLTAWKKLLREHSGKVIPGGPRWGTITDDQLNDINDGKDAEEWLTRIAPSQAGTNKPLLELKVIADLIEARNKVVDLKFSRVEVRACNLGQDVDGLKALRTFLGAGRVLAPMVKTFYGKITPTITKTSKEFRTWIGRNAPSLLTNAHPAHPQAGAATERIFSSSIPQFTVKLKPIQPVRPQPVTIGGQPVPARPGLLTVNFIPEEAAPEIVFVLKLFGQSSVVCAALGKDDKDFTAVKGFVNRYLNLKNSFSYATGPFLIGGLDAVAGRTKQNPPPKTANGKSFIFPYEAEYRAMIVATP